MQEYTQRTIEYFFKKYEVIDPDRKAKFLPLVTDIIYDYNMHIVKLEKESDEYKKNQLIEGIKELETNLEKIFADNLVN